jgi:hypothetical protein
VPITYRIDHQQKIVLARGYGLFTLGDIMDYQRAAWSGREVLGYDELVDMTHVSEVAAASGQQIKDLASFAAHMDLASAPSRLAIVAPGDLVYGLGRMFQAYREAEKRSTKQVGVFRTMNEAFAFLKQNAPLALPPLPSELEGRAGEGNSGSQLKT